MYARYYQTRRGFLLIEAMIASVILAVAAVAIITLLLSAQQQQQSIQETNTATLLGRQLMEEIAAKPFGLSTPVVPRSQMTTANQYNGYQDTTTAMTTLGNSETVSPGAGKVYSRTVTISNAPAPPGSLAPTNDLQLLSVTVTTPTGKTITLNRMLTNVSWSS